MSNLVSTSLPTAKQFISVNAKGLNIPEKCSKDSSLVTNYHPISLLNIDVKLYAKILANRLHPFLSTLVSLDQVGFIPGCEARNITGKALNIHHWLTSQNRRGFFLSLDAEKAFDRAAWDYLEATLRATGLLPQMCGSIMALYSIPQAKV